MEREYNLLEGKVILNNTFLKTESPSIWFSIKEKTLSLIGALYIFERVSLYTDKELSIPRIIWLIILYGSLSVFVLIYIYNSWIKTSLTNKLSVSNISKVTVFEEDEDNPLNVEVEIKGIFSVINLKFRKTENDFQNFISHLKRLNSKFIIKNERI